MAKCRRSVFRSTALLSLILATGLGAEALLSPRQQTHRTLFIAKASSVAVADERAAPVAVVEKARVTVSSLSRFVREARSTHAGELGLSVVNGVTVALLIKNAKLALGRMEALRARAPVAAPLLGAALVCLLYLIQPDLGTGAASIGQESAFSLRRQALRFLAVLIVVGSGNALALAGPAAEAGMAVARALSGSSGGQDLPRARALILSGAAAGFSANFDTPLAGALYALEVARRTINLPDAADVGQGQGQGQGQRESREVSVVMLAAFSAAWVVRGGWAGLGAGTRGALALPNYPPLAAAMYPRLALVAAAAALVTGAINGPLTRMLGAVFGRLPKHVRPVAGGGLVALAQLMGQPQSLPHIYVTYGDIARGAVSGAALARFALVKTLSTVASNASGLVGGMIAPFLIVGTALGAMVGGGAGPGVASFGAVGSAAVLASYFRAPLTFAVLLVEMTHQLHLLAPLLLTAALSAALGGAVGQLGQRGEK